MHGRRLPGCGRFSIIHQLEIKSESLAKKSPMTCQGRMWESLDEIPSPVIYDHNNIFIGS